MISKNEVEHIAKLARLELTEKETVKMQKDLSGILDYFDLLKKAPAGQSPSTSKRASVSQRKDEAVLKDNSLAQKLIKSAPDKKDDYIKVKAIL